MAGGPKGGSGRGTGGAGKPPRSRRGRREKEGGPPPAGEVGELRAVIGHMARAMSGAVRALQRRPVASPPTKQTGGRVEGSREGPHGPGAAKPATSSSRRRARRARCRAKHASPPAAEDMAMEEDAQASGGGGGGVRPTPPAPRLSEQAAGVVEAGGGPTDPAARALLFGRQLAALEVQRQNMEAELLACSGPPSGVAAQQRRAGDNVSRGEDGSEEEDEPASAPSATLPAQWRAPFRFNTPPTASPAPPAPKTIRKHPRAQPRRGVAGERKAGRMV